MNAAQFDEQFNRLKSHFHLGGEVDKGALGVEWFQAVKHYHVDALDHAVTMLIRGATDRFWPPLGKLLEIIRGRIAGMERTHDHCATCHGSTWIEAWPWQVNGLVYRGMQRCPDCGVPAPPIKSSTYGQPLNKTEYFAYMAGTFGREVMPDWAKAKRPARKNPEMADLADRFLAKFMRDGAPSE